MGKRKRSLLANCKTEDHQNSICRCVFLRLAVKPLDAAFLCVVVWGLDAQKRAMARLPKSSSRLISMLKACIYVKDTYNLLVSGLHFVPCFRGFY